MRRYYQHRRRSEVNHVVVDDDSRTLFISETWSFLDCSMWFQTRTTDAIYNGLIHFRSTSVSTKTSHLKLSNVDHPRRLDPEGYIWCTYWKGSIDELGLNGPVRQIFAWLWKITLNNQHYNGFNKKRTHCLPVHVFWSAVNPTRQLHLYPPRVLTQKWSHGPLPLLVAHSLMSKDFSTSSTESISTENIFHTGLSKLKRLRKAL